MHLFSLIKTNAGSFIIELLMLNVLFLIIISKDLQLLENISNVKKNNSKIMFVINI